MAILPLVYAPNPIFKQKAVPVADIDGAIRQIIDDMFETMYFEEAVGVGANMVGILKRIIVVDIRENGNKNPIAMVNPVIIDQSKETQTYLEGSICFPGISADIARSKSIKVSYLDYNGDSKSINADGYLATVLQHEIDYLEGVVFLDYLSRIKRDMLIKKMQKHIKRGSYHNNCACC